MKALKNNKGFTLIELLVVIAIIALLLAILMPSLRKAKELGQRVVCLSSVRQLTLAWRMYADDDNGEICAANGLKQENDLRDWGWVAGTGSNSRDPAVQIKSIQDGMLFPYVETMDIYTCPTAKKDEVRSYSIVASMNTNSSETKGKIYKNYTKVKSADSRLVFVCEGEIYQNAYRVLYYEPEWYSDVAPIRHSNGTVFSFVDGHSESWDWKDPRTIELSKLVSEDRNAGNRRQEDNQDLERVIRGMWGELGW